ncbi:MAG: tetratricopeptide repeat protein, partial [Oligoflexales bacterium]|nr:tetratricopeptide repeat protein [Oligoflexales bacterium]
MIKKNIHQVMFLFLLLAACSSGSKKSENSGVAKANEEVGEKLVSDEADDSTEANKNISKDSPEMTSLMEAIRSNRDENIYKAATQVLLKSPNEIRAINALGLFHYRKGHFSAAEYMFNKALKVDSQQAELHNNLGLTLMAQQDLRSAIREFRKAIDLSPAKSSASANLAAIYVKQKDYTKGLVVSEIAIKRNSADPKILNNYGICLAAAGKFDSAEQIYQQAIKINGNQPDVLLNYTILLIDHMKKYSEGLENVN